MLLAPICHLLKISLSPLLFCSPPRIAQSIGSEEGSLSLNAHLKTPKHNRGGRTMMDGAHKRRQLLLLDTDNQIAKLCKINSLFDIRNTIQLNDRLRPSSSYGDEH